MNIMNPVMMYFPYWHPSPTVDLPSYQKPWQPRDQPLTAQSSTSISVFGWAGGYQWCSCWQCRGHVRHILSFRGHLWRWESAYEDSLLVELVWVIYYFLPNFLHCIVLYWCHRLPLQAVHHRTPWCGCIHWPYLSHGNISPPHWDWAHHRTYLLSQRQSCDLHHTAERKHNILPRQV